MAWMENLINHPGSELLTIRILLISNEVGEKS
jgi:hypothetical protein